MGFGERESSMHEDQERLDGSLLKQAIEMGILQKGAHVEDLTSAVRQQMVDANMLEGAIENGFLPQGATVEDLNDELREKMAGNGLRYSVRGQARRRPMGGISAMGRRLKTR